MTTMDWTEVRNDIIKDALLDIGVLPIGEDPDAEQMAIAVRKFNSLTKFLQALNLFLWNYAEYSFNTVAASASYAITNGDAIGIDGAWWMDGTMRNNLEIIPRQTYDAISDKTVAGTPEQVFFDLTINAPKVYLFPVPNAAIAMRLRIARRLRDWDNAGDNSAGDVWPQWWIDPLRYRLAADLAITFQLPPAKIQLLEAKAQEMINSVKIDNFSQKDKGEVVMEPF